MPKWALASYLLHTILLYGSMLFISFRASVTSAFGKSVFVVTPKEDQRITLRQALVANRAEITFGVLLTAVSVYLTGSALPVVLIAVPAILCFYLALKHNTPVPEEEPADQETREPVAA
jgi:fatty acid desaturase